MSANRLLRLALCAPPALLVIASLGLLAASPGAWGAASNAKLPDWMPTASGMVLAAAGLFIGGGVLRAVLRSTRADFSIMALQMIMGGFFLLVATVVMGALALRVSESGTYTTLLDEGGRPSITPARFLLISVGFAVFLLVLGTAITYIYTQAISSNSSRFTRRAGEPDGVGEIMRGQKER